MGSRDSASPLAADSRWRGTVRWLEKDCQMAGEGLSDGCRKLEASYLLSGSVIKPFPPALWAKNLNPGMHSLLSAHHPACFNMWWLTVHLFCLSYYYPSTLVLAETVHIATLVTMATTATTSKPIQSNLYIINDTNCYSSYYGNHNSCRCTWSCSNPNPIQSTKVEVICVHIVHTCALYRREPVPLPTYTFGGNFVHLVHPKGM